MELNALQELHSPSTLLNGNDHASILPPLPLPTAAGLIKLESFHIQGLKPAAALLSFHILRFVNSLSVVYQLGSIRIISLNNFDDVQ